MAQRDYVGRGKTSHTKRNKSAGGRNKKKQPQKGISSLLIALSVIVLVIFVYGLWFISHHKKDNTPVTLPHKRAGNGLPPKPEERWKYIKELENRQMLAPTPAATVTATEAAKQPAPLTDEQRQLLNQIDADKQQQPTQLSEVPWNQQTPAEQQQAYQWQNQRKQPPETSRQNVEAKSLTNTTAPSLTNDHSPARPAPITRVQSDSSPPKTTVSQPRQWLIQCGSFKGSSQAESVRATLAFAGFESRISTGDGWNRVIIGPYTDAKKVESIASKLRHSGHNSCITRNIKG